MHRWALCAVLVASLGVMAPRQARATLHAGDVTPNFTKNDLNGNVQTLYQYRGKVVVLFLLGYG